MAAASRCLITGNKQFYCYKMIGSKFLGVDSGLNLIVFETRNGDETMHEEGNPGDETVHGEGGRDEMVHGEGNYYYYY